MAAGVPHAVASALSAPAGAVVSAVHRLRTGRKALLELTVRSWDDSVGRQRVLRCLARAASDDAVVGVLLRFHGVPGNWAACQDFRRAVLALRRSGRCVYAHL